MCSEIKIDYLAHRPDRAEALARISWNEWRDIYEARGETFEDALRKYRERTNTDRLPMALVAVAGENVVGTASLKYCDLDIRPELDPWLGGVFVEPKWRGRGVAAMLCRRAVVEAERLKIPQLYLWTHSAEGLYARLGWNVVERLEYCGKQIAVMQWQRDGD